MAECCNSGKKTVMVYPCSGGANVGEVADRAARQLMYDGDAAMFCIAGVGGKIGGMVDTAKGADMSLVIDGCNMDCSKACMDNAGLADYIHLRVTDLGIEKAKPKAATDDEVTMVVARAKEMLA